MNRRVFLRLLSAVAVTAALPVPRFLLVEPETVTPSFPIELGRIRALAAYSVAWDCMIVRLDAKSGRTHDQFGVDFKVYGMTDEHRRANYLEALGPASAMLRAAIAQHKWMATDLVALPVPSGAILPAWMR